MVKVRARLTGVAILGLSLILSAVAFGIFFYQSRQTEKSIRVVGSATKRFDSDVIKWRVTLSRNVGVLELKQGYNQIRGDAKAFVALLRGSGIPAGEITLQPVNTNQIFSQYREDGQPVGYSVTQNIIVASRRLAQVEKLALNPDALVERGIIMQSSSLEYYYSRLAQVKRELLAAATVDGRGRAAEIARSTGDRLGRIISARAGVFQITEPNSTEVSDYGIYNTSTKEKDITVTVSAVFQLK